MKKYVSLIIAFVLGGLSCLLFTTSYAKETEEHSVDFENIYIQREYVDVPIPIPYTVEQPVFLYQDGHGNEVPCTEEELNLLVNLVWFESGNQDEYGRRLVIDTVLNRVRSKYFPNTIKEVLNQHVGDVYQYGVIKKLNSGATHYLKENESLVCDEIMTISNRDVIYFQRGGYFSCGTPLFQHGDHYFTGLRKGLK